MCCSYQIITLVIVFDVFAEHLIVDVALIVTSMDLPLDFLAESLVVCAVASLVSQFNQIS